MNVIMVMQMMKIGEIFQCLNYLVPTCNHGLFPRVVSSVAPEDEGACNFVNGKI